MISLPVVQVALLSPCDDVGRDLVDLGATNTESREGTV